MHPALRRHVAPPTIHTGRYIAVGALTGFAGIVCTLAIVRLADVRAETPRRTESPVPTEARDHRDQVRARTLAAAQARALDDTRTAAGAYAHRAYPGWVVAHPDQACPSRLSEVTPYMPQLSTFDPWGMAYRFDCNGKQLTVSSAGPDRTYGTTDDIVGGR
jgi:hypothetical protein